MPSSAATAAASTTRAPKDRSSVLRISPPSFSKSRARSPTARASSSSAKKRASIAKVASSRPPSGSATLAGASRHSPSGSGSRSSASAMVSPSAPIHWTRRRRGVCSSAAARVRGARPRSAGSRSAIARACSAYSCFRERKISRYRAGIDSSRSTTPGSSPNASACSVSRPAWYTANASGAVAATTRAKAMVSSKRETRMRASTRRSGPAPPGTPPAGVTAPPPRRGRAAASGTGERPSRAPARAGGSSPSRRAPSASRRRRATRRQGWR